MNGNRHSADSGEVVKFRPRTSSRPPTPAAQGLGRYFRQPVADDPGKFEHEINQPDDYRQRMAMNVAALAFTVVLTAAGIWLALKIADLKSTQDCVLMGRRDCAHLSTPAN